ncbi:MAG: hypothetical protein QN183_13140 [Armatimonadota bacterium]|nr:hypothetical protein [Armatimonadota bacterium]MDR7485953.1 hypothetical protein [Armatimonadota bacterium]MDR7532169.1 hypothetical protein [Armatimonadota bacterium]MDR7537295.1 hypothetical protein [Armatimonadota bacterium]
MPGLPIGTMETHEAERAAALPEEAMALADDAAVGATATARGP